MSVFLVIRIPGGTQEQYDQVEAGLKQALAKLLPAQP